VCDDGCMSLLWTSAADRADSLTAKVRMQLTKPVVSRIQREVLDVCDLADELAAENAELREALLTLGYQRFGHGAIVSAMNMAAESAPALAIEYEAELQRHTIAWA
jgi:CelD/BcsL family acetyltransferase involved in cellulose biosynthesis